MIIAITFLLGGDFLMNRTNQTYTTEFKLEVVQAYLNGEGGYKAIAQKYGIRSKTQVENWVKRY